jgi:hypothetical protein
MRKPSPTGTSLRAWFGLFAVACAWLALFANFPSNARQLLDVVWHLCFDATPSKWMYYVFYKHWCEWISMAALCAAIYLAVRGRPREYCLALLGLAWAFCGWALIVGIVDGHQYIAVGGFQPYYRDFFQEAWLVSVFRNLLPTLLLTIIVQALGVVSWAPRTNSERWLTCAWLVMMANIGILLYCGMLVVEHGYPQRESTLDYPSLHHRRELFTPGSAVW